MVNYAIFKLSCLECKRLYGCNCLAPDNLAADHFFQVKSFSAFAENMYFNENIFVRPFRCAFLIEQSDQASHGFVEGVSSKSNLPIP